MACDVSPVAMFIIVIVLYFCCICICNEILFNKWNVRQHSHPVGWKDAAVSGTCVTKKNMVLVLYLYCIYYVLVLKCQTTQSRRKGATVSGTCVTKFCYHICVVFLLYLLCAWNGLRCKNWNVRIDGHGEKVLLPYLEHVSPKMFFIVFVLYFHLYLLYLYCSCYVLVTEMSDCTRSRRKGAAAISGTCVTKTIFTRPTCSFSRPSTIHHPMKTSKRPPQVKRTFIT